MFSPWVAGCSTASTRPWWGSANGVRQYLCPKHCINISCCVKTQPALQTIIPKILLSNNVSLQPLLLCAPHISEFEGWEVSLPSLWNRWFSRKEPNLGFFLLQPWDTGIAWKVTFHQKNPFPENTFLRIEFDGLSGRPIYKGCGFLDYRETKLS